MHRLLDSASAAAPEDSFYNRTTEQENFNDMFSGEPGLMTVLVGPRNSGKTVRPDFACRAYPTVATTTCKIFFCFASLDSFEYSCVKIFHPLSIAEIFEKVGC